MKNQKLKGNLLLFLAAFIWGTSFIAQSKGVESISPVAFNGIRSMLGAIVLFPVILLLDNGKRKRGIPVQKADKTLLLGGIICGIFLCLATTVQTAGMVYTSPGKAGFITALYMVFIPIVELFLGKKPSPVILLSVLIATVGLYLMCIDTDLTINKGDVMVLFCAVLFTGHILAIDYFSPKVDGVKLSCLQFFVCGVLNMGSMFLFESPELMPILRCWMSIGYSGIMSCGVAYTLQIVGQKYTDPTSASILMSLESVFATLSTVVLVALGWSLTGGALTPREIIGCVLMFVAIILVQLPSKPQKAIV
ncbi:MAG: DMT family transporter [Clostridia bacterium]|nr:DMT family transporter [Clostridia bacterium]